MTDTMPEAQERETFGVTVPQVKALAAQVALDADNTGPVDDVFNNPQSALSKALRVADVQLFIERISGYVSVKLRRRRRLKPTSREEFNYAVSAVVEVGAAAYLVDAAYPQRAGVNDQASYGQVLWNRYKMMLEDLDELLDDLIRDDEEDDDNGDKRPAVGSSFPPAIFTDGYTRSGHQPPNYGSGFRAPGAEYPRR